MRSAIACLALLGLTACGNAAQDVEESRAATIDIRAFEIAGKPVRCIPWEPLNLLQTNSNELKGELRNRFLTPAAEAAGARVFTVSSDVSMYGSTTVFYTNAEANCILFAETIGMQEYTTKAGLDPTVVTTGYERVAAPPPAPAPIPAPTPSPTPSETPE